MASDKPLYSFPLVVQGDWGSPEPPKPLRLKLQSYFQSKKSGGGECEIQLRSGDVFIVFSEEDARQRVLSRRTHVLDLREKGTLNLVVAQHETSLKENASKKQMDPNGASEEDQAANTDVQRELREEDLAIRRRSTGEIPSHTEVLPPKSEVSSRVILENIEQHINDTSLFCLLVERISGETDFQIEWINERNAAVLTFQQSSDAAHFIKECNKNHRFKELKITARLLELTQMIRVENIPAGIHKDHLYWYFENPKHGGGIVEDVQILAEEDSAIITFSDQQAVQRVLEKQHIFCYQQILVYPYYCSLETALYGKERPQIKMPEPFTVSLDHYVWKFLQDKDKIIQEINQDMASHDCDLQWPQIKCEHPEIVMQPSATLSKNKPSVVKSVKTWKDRVYLEIVSIMSKFRSVSCRIIPEAWEAIEKNMIKNVLAIPDDSKTTVILAGFVFSVDNEEKLINEYVENKIKDVEKAKQIIKETVLITPIKYAVLNNMLLKENIYKDNPDIKISYDLSSKTMQLCGMPADVYKIKSEVVEKLYGLEEKKISIHPQIFQFLQHTDSKKVAAVLFGASNINAFYELGSDSLILVTHSPQMILKAEEQMQKKLDHKSVTLENQELVRKKEWKELIRNLLKKHNSTEETVIIDDCFIFGEDAKVTIAGYTKAVIDVYQELSSFVEKNTKMLKVIPVAFVAIVLFIEKENSKIWNDLRKKGVKIEFGSQTKQKNIILSGPRSEVVKAATVVEQTISSVHAVRVRFDKPGVKNFFKTREHAYITEAKTYFNCLIRLQRDGEDDGGIIEKVGHPYSKITFKNGVVVEVHKGDLTSYLVDVVVNAANGELKHSGGLANAVLKRAGQELQAECDKLVRKYGQVKAGRAIISGAWNLPCKQLIHAVGPVWNSNNNAECTKLLKSAVRESLKLAETYNHNSIALPAISSGIFGFPVKECAYTIVTAIKEALEESAEDCSLKRIHLVDVSDNTVQAFADALNEVFKVQPTLPRPLTTSQPVNQPKDTNEDLQKTSLEGLKLLLEEKGIEEATTDVIVSSIGTDLKLGVGPLSQAVLKKAGPQLQADFDQVIQGQKARGGCIIQTNGYNLACSVIFHVVVPQWDGGRGPAKKILRDIVRECLEKTEELSLSSVSFPAIGTGGFKFPKSEVAKLMIEEVLKFSSKKNFKSLQEVHFLLHPKDYDNLQAFSELFKSRTGEVPKIIPPSDGQSAGFYGVVSTPVSGVHEMQIGPIQLKVLIGDITKEDTDVIVNMANEAFNSKAGVSKAILEGAGSQVEQECAQLALLPHSGFITTDSGNLICKKIIHLAPDSDIKRQVSLVLQECEAKKYISVAIPAIGTGQAGKAPAEAADDLIDAIADFAGKETPQHLKLIKIVVFQPYMHKDFYASMKNREGAALPTKGSVFSRLKEFVFGKKPPAKNKSLLLLERKVEITVFEICGESKNRVEEAESWLKKLILDELAENCISDEIIELFEDTEIKKLNDLQKSKAICLERKQSPPCILISGIPRAVLSASAEIQELIKKLKTEREEKSKAELAQKFVEWQYCIKGDSFVPFDLVENLHLEDAKTSGTLQIDIQINGNRYKANLKKMCATDAQGKNINIRRRIKDEGKLFENLPKEWEDMGNARVKVVALQLNSQEYASVAGIFQRTCSTFKLEKIERIQNPYLWQAYQVKKEEMDKKNGHKYNEKFLFHGTAVSTLTPINQTGFNRSYAGKNAAMIGNGTYFAVNANYSAQDTYSIPDASGRKYMYYARVLTGDYCLGKQGQITPSSKTNGGFELYDSVTDNLQTPSMFVIFYDAQAYPEYLITFRK